MPGYEAQQDHIKSIKIVVNFSYIQWLMTLVLVKIRYRYILWKCEKRVRS